MHNHELLIILCVFTFVDGIPLNRYGNERVDVELNCDNLALVTQFTQLFIPFRCMRRQNDLIYEEINDSGEHGILIEEIYQPIQPRPVRADRQPLEPNYQRCPTGYTHDRPSHTCILNRPQALTKPKVVQVRPKCPEGYVYSSEIDLCMPYTRPPVGHLIAARQVDPAHAPSVIVDRPRTCGPHAVYNPSVDLCLPRGPARTPTTPTTTTTRKPFRLTLAPIVKYTNGRRCPEGKVYVTEIDLCLSP